MNGMFFGCSSLKELNLNNFNINNVKYKKKMFYRCSNELKLEMKSKFKNLDEETFED